MKTVSTVVSPTSFAFVSCLPADFCETGDAQNSTMPMVRLVVDGQEDDVLALFCEKPHMSIRQAAV